MSAVEVVGNALIDRRFGITQKVPESFRLKSKGAAFGESGQRALWEAPDASLTLVTMVPGESSGISADFLEAIDKATRASVPPALLRQKQASTMTINGEIGDRASYVGLNYRFDTLILRHKQMLFGWLFAGRNADRLAELANGLKWTD